MLFFKMFKRFRKVVLEFNFKKKMRKNWGKLGKKADPESPNIHYYRTSCQLHFMCCLQMFLIWTSLGCFVCKSVFRNKR